MFAFARSKSRHEARKLEALDRSLAIIEFSPDGAILCANENFCALFGYAPAELVGQPHRLLVDPAFAQSEDYGAFWRKLSGGAFDSGVYARRRKDGAPVQVRATYNPVKDGSGKVVSVLKVAADVTQARMESLENAVRMAALSRVQCVVEFKPNGEVIDANARFLAALGYSREQVVGRNHSLFVERAYAQGEEYRAFWRRLNAGEQIVDSFPRIAADGRKVWLQCAYSPVAGLDGRVYKIVKFAHDITDLLMLGDGLARLARGDLSERLETPFSPTFDRLRTDFNTASDNLARVLGGIADASSALGASAAEIASAARDLSSRTEGQAASLEESASALGEVTERVDAATKNAHAANRAVGAAKDDAGRSGEIVVSAVEAMGRLERSSKEIGAIIGVIDEIAFQTNLLALNAGVEAARAGETGRGFAVVASEVRALAQRSAEAARQIKGLISASATDVSAGVGLVRKAGDSLGAIVAKVVEIDRLVGGIATSAEEQNSALGEVNTAVARMDEATQRNAALAEEASAAVATLNTQIERLNEALGSFTLGRGRVKRAMRLAA